MRENIIQITGAIVLTMLLIGGLLWWSTRDSAPKELLLTDEGKVEEFAGPYATDTIQDKTPIAMHNENNPVAVVTTNKGVIEIELFADQMPITTANFIKLAKEGYYDGIKFHRVIKDFMIQGGDPNTKTDNTASYGTGGPGYTIQDEFVTADNLSNVRGTIAMANTGQPNSGGSQFFINTKDNTFLDFDKEPLTSRHPVFGKVIAGMDVVTAVEAVPTGARDLPTDPVTIESLVIRE